MPSFLNEDNAPVLSTGEQLVNLDSRHRFGFPLDKKNVDVGPIEQTNHTLIDQSFEESSNESTHDSDGSDSNNLPVNGSYTRPTSMSSVANGVGPPNDPEPRPNGSFALPDRSSTAKRATTGANGDASSSGTHTDSEPTPLSNTIDRDGKGNGQLPVGGLTPLQTNGDDARAQEQDGRSPGLGTDRMPEPNAPVAHGDPSPAELVLPTKSSPHRFSSPPAYQPGSSTLNTSSSGHLQPPVPGSALKQRHTIEMPKLPPGRNSRESADNALASGRFSPTIPTPGHRRPSLNLARRATRSMQSDAPRDEILPDEDAMRWAAAYRQKRASKRRRKEEEDDDRVLVGTKVDESHANWVTAYNMLTGIRVSVSRTNAKLDRDLTDADFQAKQKSTFDITGNELVPSAKYDFKFKDYAPWVFRHLRTLFRLDPADYLMSLTGNYILSELGSPGKSGSFFYFSRDYKYIIKTIHHSEHKFLRKILKDYYTHVQENPNTLLSQFYGLHRVKLPYGKKIHFVVMNNLFPPHRDIHTTFDLKGSTVGRDYREDELEKNPRATLKDLNWLRRQQHLELGIQKKRLFLEQLRRDVVLLKRLQIMDYSLLIGIHDLSRGNDENLRGKTLQVFNPGGERSAEDEQPPSVLMRTPSKLETVRKAKELREKIRQERPVPMGHATDRMPDELGEGHSRPGFVFNQDDGGFRATHEDNSPAEEIYYLGVIDCLTHYGMIKKIEHFWKGLSSDRTQISALPPDQYGDRFYNFVEGVTLSAEESRREAQRREKEAMEGKTSTEKSKTQKHHHGIPEMSKHLPPVPPSAEPISSGGRETVEKASLEARRSQTGRTTEADVPDRTLTTAKSPPEKRDSMQHEPILPVVEEAAESSRADGADEENETWNNKMPRHPAGPPPPTPPKDEPPAPPKGFLRPSDDEPKRQELRHRLSRESMNKTLPPLPTGEDAPGNGGHTA